MTRQLLINASLALLFLTIPLLPAHGQQVGTDRQRPMVWTNEDLEKLHDLGLISIVGQVDEDRSTGPSAPETYVETQDPEWYAEQAADLRGELENIQAQLSDFQQAIDDVRSLKQTTGGISLDYGSVGITPEDAIENLQEGVDETQSDLDELEDLARRNGIPPGVLRGQTF
jgi:hypothetical protein